MRSKTFFWGTALLFLGLCIVAYISWRSKAADHQSGPIYQFVNYRESKAEIKLFIVGDFGSGNDNQWLVAKAMEHECQINKPDALVLLGDNIYMAGVQSIDDPLWHSVIEKPLSSPCLSDLPIYPILGNHDYKGDANAQIAYTKKSKRWNMPNRFYSVNFSNLLELIAIDTNVADFCWNSKNCTVDFLNERLEESRAITRIVLGHHHLTSASKKYKNGFQGWALKPAICAADAYISGHAHHFEHRRDEKCGADLFVVGTGGADLSPTIEDPSSLHKESHYGFLMLTASRTNVDYRFVRANQSKTYQYISQLDKGNRFLSFKSRK